MQIFEREKRDGFEKAIASSATCNILASLTNKKVKDIESIIKSSASIDDFDIYKSYSLLVSTCWNDNDDVFVAAELWKARKTPIFKRSNYEHDETKTIGVMTNCWAVRDDYSIIDDDTPEDEVPNMFHLIVEDIIYREWEDEKTKAFVNDLISGIESGEYSVSMECLFPHFDYAVIAPDGTYHELARTEETSFLSKHLRMYGGSGSYQQHKIGRILRGIVFSGKGYTINPANKRSMTMTPEMFMQFTSSASKTEKFELLETSSVDDSVTDLVNTNNGSELMELQEALAELTKIQAENSALASKLEDALQSKEVAVASLKEKEALVADLQTKIEEALASVQALNDAKAAVEAELNQIKQEQVKASRIGLFTQAGFSSDEAEGYFNKFSNLADEQFEAIAGIAIQAKKAQATQETSTDEVEVEVEEVAEEVVVEEASAADSSSVQNDQQEELTAQAGLKAWASSIFNSKKNK